jgi:hypothetical protein
MKEIFWGSLDSKMRDIFIRMSQTHCLVFFEDTKYPGMKSAAIKIQNCGSFLLRITKDELTYLKTDSLHYRCHGHAAIHHQDVSPIRPYKMSRITALYDDAQTRKAKKEKNSMEEKDAELKFKDFSRKADRKYSKVIQMHDKERSDPYGDKIDLGKFDQKCSTMTDEKLGKAAEIDLFIADLNGDRPRDKDHWYGNNLRKISIGKN